jgi:hypothetical protein
MDLEAEEEAARRGAGLEGERVGVVVGGAGGAPRPHGGEEEEGIAVEGGPGERAEEDVEEYGGAVRGGREDGAGGREGGAGGVGLDELDARDGGGGVGGEVLEEEASVRGTDGGEVRRRAAGFQQAEEGVLAAGRG